MQRTDVTYNKEIQGLRAFAVISVIICHLNGSIPGGFIGVDIFFVISGYVITKTLLNEKKQTGTIKLSKFYLRRINRILPASYVVALVTLICAVLLLPNSEFEFFLGSFFSSIGMISNFYFWKEIDYFSPAADHIPLLHMWSLALEEQFYLFFPILFIIFKQTKTIHDGLSPSPDLALGCQTPSQTACSHASAPQWSGISP